MKQAPTWPCAYLGRTRRRGSRELVKSQSLMYGHYGNTSYGQQQQMQQMMMAVARRVLKFKEYIV